jgi:chloramphenicol 3-O-phosphotransferase
MRQRVDFVVVWLPQDAYTYRSRQRRKDEEIEWIRRLEEAVHRSRERELSMEMRMKELEECKVLDG